MMNRIKEIFSLLVILALLLGGFPFGGQPAAAADGQGIILTPFKPPVKGNPKLDSQLNQLISANASGPLSFALGKSGVLSSKGARVVVECLPGKVDAVKKAVGANVTVETGYGNLLQVTAPISRLAALAAISDIRLVRLPQHPVPFAVTSEGVRLANANDWQAAGYNGTGVKIGILDGGFADYATHQSQGEVPPAVATYWSPSIGQGTSTHGTACTEVVYDIAPGAQYYLTNFYTEVEMGNAVNWLISQNVTIISCSVGYNTISPGDGTGIICEMVTSARSAGILWSQAIGNSAQTHWQGLFNDPDSDLLHNFSGSDETNPISAAIGQVIRVEMKWDDPYGTSSNDYDLYLFYDINGDHVFHSLDRNCRLFYL